MRHLPLLLFLLISHAVYANNVELELDTGTPMSLSQYEGEGKTLLLWLPSERGFGEGYVPVALNLAALDIDVWIAHLHETYIIPPGRESLNQVDLDDLLALVAEAQAQGFESIYLLSSGRGMQLALKTAYQWQKQHPQDLPIKGLITFSPHLIKGRTEMGEEADYLELAAHSNLPVYMIQPQYSTKFARSWEIAEQLQRGGSPVFIHFLKGVQGGFHMRPNEDLNEIDLSMRAQLPQVLEQAMQLLRQTRAAPYTDQYDIAQSELDEDDDELKQPMLHPFQGDQTPPPIQLKDLNGRPFDLVSTRGEVVLVNFWATWCRPCVEEIPSLSRLVKAMEGKPFKVIAVNIGESAEDIRKFTQSIPLNFDILLDKNGATVRDWKVYAYPSNYLLDKQGRIRYAYRGALQWDAPAIVQTIEELL